MKTTIPDDNAKTFNVVREGGERLTFHGVGALIKSLFASLDQCDALRSLRDTLTAEIRTLKASNASLTHRLDCNYGFDYRGLMERLRDTLRTPDGVDVVEHAKDIITTYDANKALLREVTLFAHDDPKFLKWVYVRMQQILGIDTPRVLQTMRDRLATNQSMAETIKSFDQLRRDDRGTIDRLARERTAASRVSEQNHKWLRDVGRAMHALDGAYFDALPAKAAALYRATQPREFVLRYHGPRDKDLVCRVIACSAHEAYTRATGLTGCLSGYVRDTVTVVDSLDESTVHRFSGDCDRTRPFGDAHRG